MHRPCLFLSLLLLAPGVHACELAPSGVDAVSLKVAGSGCLGTDAQRQAFAAGLKSAVQSMDASRRRGPQRKSTADQLNGFGDLKRQSQHLSPPPTVYYGQR